MPGHDDHHARHHHQPTPATARIEELAKTFTLPPLRLAGKPPQSSRAVTFSSWCTTRLVNLMQPPAQLRTEDPLSVPSASYQPSGPLLPSPSSAPPAPPVFRPIIIRREDAPAQSLLEEMRAKLSSADPLPLDDPLNHMASVLGPIVSTTRVYKEVTDLQPLLQHTLFGAAAMVTSDVRNFLQIQDFAQSRGWEWAGNVPSLPNRRKTAAKRLADLLIEQVVASGSSALPPAVASPPPSSRNALGPRTSSLTEVPVAFNPAEELPESNSRTSSATTSQHAVTAPPVVNKDSLEKELNTLFGGFSDHVYQVQGTVYWLVEEKLPSALSSDELRQFVDTLRSATVFLTAEGLQPGATMRELLESGSLKVAYQSFGNGSIPMAVGSTMSRVLPQLLQQMVLNNCPRVMLSNWETAVLFYLDPTCSIQVSQFITLDPSPLVRQTSEALQCSMLELILMLECHALRLANLRKQGASLENEVWAEPGVPILAPDVVRETLYENAQGSGSRSRKRKRQGDEAQDPTECGDHSFSSSDSATSVNLVSPNRQTRAEQKAHACLQLDTSDLCAEDKAVLGLENNLIPLRLVVEGSDVLLAGPALPTNPWRLKLGERIGHGRLGVAYRATLSTDQETCDIVAKVINLNGAHIKPDEDGDIRVYPTVAHVSVAAKVEAHAYATLADVQGRLVPEYYGLFSTDNETTFVALMSPGGKDVDALHVSMIPTIINTYDQLHALGVIHGDVDLRHILCGADPQPLLIDFEGATLRAYTSETEWNDRTEEEMARVRRMLVEQGALM